MVITVLEFYQLTEMFHFRGRAIQKYKEMNPGARKRYSGFGRESAQDIW